MSLNWRREVLSHTQGFKCSCKHCVEEEKEGFNCEKDAFKCKSCSKGYFYSLAWKCLACSADFTKEEMNEIETELKWA